MGIFRYLTTGSTLPDRGTNCDKPQTCDEQNHMHFENNGAWYHGTPDNSTQLTPTYAEIEAQEAAKREAWKEKYGEDY